MGLSQEAERAGRRAGTKAEDGSWLDRAAGRITFHDDVEQVWWPSRQLQLSTQRAVRDRLLARARPGMRH